LESFNHTRSSAAFITITFGTHKSLERAKAKGIKLGRRPKLDAEMVRVAAERYAKGETMAELADVYGVSEPTIWRALQ
jgi:DNA invertase Pin-like site-specific DNA recombinase